MSPPSLAGAYNEYKYHSPLNFHNPSFVDETIFDYFMSRYMPYHEKMDLTIIAKSEGSDHPVNQMRMISVFIDFIVVR